MSSTPSPSPLAVKDIGDEIGHHITLKLGGFVFNLDTIWSTAIAIAIVLGLGLLLRAKATSGVPGRLQLIWEGAFARSYRIEASDDGSNWRQLYTTADGNGDVDDLGVPGSGRYVRLTGTQRGTGFGYSLYEFGIYRN